MKKNLLLSAASGIVAVTMFASTALAAPVLPEAGSVAIQALERHGLLTETAPKGPAQIGDDGSASVGGITVQPESAGRGTEKPQLGVVVVEGAESTDVVVQNIASGVRFLSVLKDAQAPTSFEYRFPSATLTKYEDGSVAVKAADGSRAAVLPAWALDSNGASVPTEYQIRGDILIQQVSHAGFAYPVVADPAVSTCLVNIVIPAVCIKANRSETERAYGQIAVAAGASAAIGTMCGIIPSAGPAAIVKAGCAALLARNVTDLTITLNKAHSEGKCIEERIPALVTPLFLEFNVVKC